MSLRILVDESADSGTLRRELRDAGHSVALPIDAGLLDARDAVLFVYARSQNMTIVTSTPKDFRSLHKTSPDHAGILLVYNDNDPTRDMRPSEIVRAIANLEASGLPIYGAMHVLNHWRY